MLNALDSLRELKSLIMELEWTTRLGLSGITSLIAVFVFFRPFYALMKRSEIKEVMREDDCMGKLRDLHASKKNTITMGGVLMIMAIVPSTLIWAEWNVYIKCALLVMLGFGAIGFFDDYLKVSKKNKKGLDGKFKLLGQLAISVIALYVLLEDKQSANHIRELWIPMTEVAFMPLMPIWMTFGLLLLVLVATSNTVNLTDGADGLAIGCSISSLLAFGIVAYLASTPALNSGLNLNHISGAQEISVLCVSIVGAGFGFLWFNGHPAKVFMGDTGSLSLGGTIGIVAFMLNQPFILILIGGIFVIEGLSVILQVASFQLTGRRLFLISPIHHHFEVAGWPETQVVTRFWILSVVFALVGIWTVTV
jgi:phospho-N-acetylmuramoyl-pentapeptide-transferase